MAFIAALIPAGAAIIGSLVGGAASRQAASAASDANAASLQLQRDMFDKQNELQKPFRDAGIAGQNKLMYLLGLSPDPSMQGMPSQRSGTVIRDRGGMGDSGGPNGVFGTGGMATNALMGMQAQGQPQGPASGLGSYGSLARNFGMNDFQADPGYQFRLEQGQKALERSAAARGGLFSGRAAKDLTNFGQGSASQEYGNAYNRYQTDRSNLLNPLQAFADQAQSATNQVGQAAQNFGQSGGQAITAGGDARASGYIGQGNAITGGLNSLANLYQQQDMMKKYGVGS